MDKLTVEEAFQSLVVPLSNLKTQQKDAVMALFRERMSLLACQQDSAKLSSLHGKESIVLIISPLIALTVDQCKRFVEMGLECGAVGESDDTDAKILDGKYQIVMSSPETILHRLIIADFRLLKQVI